jgi:hypothetical protein
MNLYEYNQTTRTHKHAHSGSVMTEPSYTLTVCHRSQTRRLARAKGGER